MRLCAGRWEPERSPMAAIPRDYQAGPDATPIHTNNNNNNNNSHNHNNNNNNNRDDKLHALNGKYRQYLRSQRIHPYLMSTGGGGAAFPQLHSATAFQQMQPVSCYNV